MLAFVIPDKPRHTLGAIGNPEIALSRPHFREDKFQRDKSLIHFLSFKIIKKFYNIF